MSDSTLMTRPFRSPPAYWRALPGNTWRMVRANQARPSDRGAHSGIIDQRIVHARARSYQSRWPSRANIEGWQRVPCSTEPAPQPRGRFLFVPGISGHDLQHRTEGGRVTKFIFVSGGVVSSVGKGITVASLGRLLKSRGVSVSVMKLDPYINIDPGTMSPFQHGEVFVTDDGAETDLDLGHYERVIDANLTRSSNVTTGQVYSAVISRE